ncbi:uncharacterized protein LOC142523986 [Primulina tabacum]|uniref:uncharacterized protein LOC142523986 n=1 Tax=Primulina tabacum TaxID=48773 RepID=UPI003F59E917
MAAGPEDDDFSFPATTSVPPPHFMESPPLWRLPRQNHYQEFDFCSSSQELRTCNSNTNFPATTAVPPPHFKFCLFQELKPKSSVITQRRSYSYGDYEDERMDVLWEDLNEDVHFSRNCVKMAETCDNANSSPGRAVQVSCIEALKLSRSNGHRFSGKKPKILVFIKILKKVLVHRNSRCSIKKRAW